MEQTLPIPPPLPGYTWRALRQEDAAALYQLALDCAPLDGSTNVGTLASYQALLDELVSTLATDTLCAVDADGRLAARAWVSFDDSFGHEYRAVLDGLVHPDQRGQGLGSFILRWMEARVRQRCPAGDARPLVLRIDFYDRGADAITLYEQHGFRFQLAEDEMRRDLGLPLPTERLPDGLSFVTWSAERARLFFEAYQQAFGERPGFPGWDEATWRQALTGHSKFRADLSLLVTDGSAGVAYAICAVGEPAPDQRPVGWIVQLGVDPAWRRRGLAAALLAEAMRRFQAEGLPYAMLDVNANNPQAFRVYQRLGFEPTKRYTSYRKTLSGEERASSRA